MGGYLDTGSQAARHIHRSKSSCRLGSDRGSRAGEARGLNLDVAEDSSDVLWLEARRRRPTVAYSIGRVEIPVGSRPASTQPISVATIGMAITMRKRLLQGM